MYHFKAGASSLSDWEVLSDNECAVPIFRNRRLLSNLRAAPEPLSFIGITGSDNALEVNMIGDLDGFGTVYYHPDAQADVLSWGECFKLGCRMEWVQERNHFTITTSDGSTTRVFCCKDGLYKSDFCREAHPRVQAYASTVEENKKLFTQRELKEIETAVKFRSAMGNKPIPEILKILSGVLYGRLSRLS